MGRKLRYKRHAASVVLHQAAWMVNHGRMILFSFLRENNAQGHHRLNPLQGCLTEKEYRLISQRMDGLDRFVTDLRKLAWHLAKGAKEDES